MHPSPPSAQAMRAINQDKRRQQIRAEQTRLLYANLNIGISVTVFAALVLAYLQRRVIPQPVLAGWLLYMLVVSSARCALGRRYRRTSPAGVTVGRWSAAFAIGVGLSAIGWGATGILLYPAGHLGNQVLLAFVVGGMMLGAASRLATRPEAYLAFLIPTGIPTAIRFLLEGDDLHVAMGVLAIVFTSATLITTRHIYKTVAESLRLRFENEELMEDLRLAKEQTEALNQGLELRVRERTAEVHRTNERLQVEIEQRKQVEEELLRARKLEALGVLAGGIAHDFNNFLTIVQGNIALAKRQLECGEPASDTLEDTVAACRRAASLALQLLTFGKGGAPVRRIVSVARVVNDAVALARAGAQVGISIGIADDLWPAEIDDSQISHALYNILLNARQAMQEGGIIEIRAGNVICEPGFLPIAAGQYVLISVRDYGCGIPSEVLPRIFDPYFTTKETGTGLGLATAYAIVAKHQGLITVQSTVGVETTFNIYLPACAQSPLPEVAASGLLHGGWGRILVMDDEAALRRLLERLLERLGYQVECARDGAEAIALYEAAKATGRGFDAVLLDVTVPGGMGGVEAASKLREIDPSAKLIVSSGYSDAPVMSEFRRYHFDAVLPKPWTPAGITEMFKRVLAANPEPREH